MDSAVEPFRRLHKAQRVIASDLTLSTLPTRIVDAAYEVLGVDCAALAMLAPDGAIDGFVHVGLDDVTASRVQQISTGTQLSALLREWSTNPSDSATDDGASIPPDGSTRLLCAAVTAGDEHFGDLYVAAPRAGTFSDTDRELIESLSRSAGSAIAHARLFDREHLGTEWLHASGEVARALLAEADVDMVTEIVARAVAASNADYGQIVIPTIDGRIEVIAAAGVGTADQLGVVYDPSLSPLGTLVVQGRTVRTSDVSTLLSDRFVNKHRYGPAMVTPLADAQGIRGSIMLARVAGKSDFAGYELDLFATYAAQVALAMQFADARADAERLQLLDTRHQTARELHDIVMQRLFATGVGLSTIADQLTNTGLAEQLGRYISELDETIDEIRERVFGSCGDAQAVSPTRSRFPRVARDTALTLAGTAIEAAGTALDTGATAVRSMTSAARKPRRGRRRTDWEDGSGTQGR